MAGAVAALLGARDGRRSCCSACCSRPGSSRSSRPGFDGREARGRRSGWSGSCFPGAGLLVLSAWCLGVLNSHRRFFLCYSAPVLWNLAIIAALIGFGPRRGAVSAGRDRGVGLGGGQPAPVRACSCPTVHAAARRAPGRGWCAGSAHVARGAAELRPGVRRPRRRPDQRLRRHRAREPAAHRRGRRALLRPGALHAAGEPVRHVGLGGGAAGDGERRGRPRPSGPPTCASGSTPGCGRSRSSSCPRRWPSWRWATWWRARCTSRARSPGR